MSSILKTLLTAVLVALIGLGASAATAECADEAHESNCTPDCACVCASVPVFHAHHHSVNGDFKLIAWHRTEAAPLRPDRLQVSDIFRPPLAV
jgi:hypothetical protein